MDSAHLGHIDGLESYIKVSNMIADMIKSGASSEVNEDGQVLAADLNSISYGN